MSQKDQEQFLIKLGVGFVGAFSLFLALVVLGQYIVPVFAFALLGTGLYFGVKFLNEELSKMKEQQKNRVVQPKETNQKEYSFMDFVYLLVMIGGSILFLAGMHPNQKYDTSYIHYEKIRHVDSLKTQLKDPKSLEVIQHNTDKDGVGYITYRAKNSLGGYVTESAVVTQNGIVVPVK